MNILEALYPENEIFVKDQIFNREKLSVETNCFVPQESNYTSGLLDYVTAENYIRCLSQSSYLLAHYLVVENLLQFIVNEKVFIEAMLNNKLYYRNSVITFHKCVKKDEYFKITLEVKTIKEIKLLNNSFLLTFLNKRTVISGEISFIYVK